MAAARSAVRASQRQRIIGFYKKKEGVYLLDQVNEY
jgi:hypothetical protein